MIEFPARYLVIAALFSLMAIRAFVSARKSASKMDYLLGAALSVGLLLLLSNYRQFALYFLLGTAVAYLASQIATGARPMSHMLPLAGVAMIVFALCV